MKKIFHYYQLICSYVVAIAGLSLANVAFWQEDYFECMGFLIAIFLFVAPIRIWFLSNVDAHYRKLVLTLLAVAMVFCFGQSDDKMSNEVNISSSSDSQQQQRVLGEFMQTKKVLLDRVIDGDTIDIALDGEIQRVRLIGIDTPERGECLYQEATDYLRNLLHNRSIRIEFDETQGLYDRYDRLLAYVFVDDRNAGEILIANGFAHEYTYRKAYAYQDDFREVETHAKTQDIGIWSDEICP